MNSEKPLSSGFQFAPDGWARAVLVLIWALRALIVFINSNFMLLDFLKFKEVFFKNGKT